MKSGLRDRNNVRNEDVGVDYEIVSMKSGLRDRNNLPGRRLPHPTDPPVSMKSGLRDRNNYFVSDNGLTVLSLSQ